MSGAKPPRPHRSKKFWSAHEQLRSSRSSSAPRRPTMPPRPCTPAGRASAASSRSSPRSRTGTCSTSRPGPGTRRSPSLRSSPASSLPISPARCWPRQPSSPRAPRLANVETARAEAGNLPFPDASFDLVTCRLAAHHFPDPDAFVREAWRVLKPRRHLRARRQRRPRCGAHARRDPGRAARCRHALQYLRGAARPEPRARLEPRRLVGIARRRRLHRRASRAARPGHRLQAMDRTHALQRRRPSSGSTTCSTTTCCAPSCARAKKRASASSRCRKPSSSRASRARP